MPVTDQDTTITRARWGPICGVVFVVLLVGSLLSLGSTPDPEKSPDYVLDWYREDSHRTKLWIMVLLVNIAVVFGVFFFAYLRDRLARVETGVRLNPLLLVGMAIFAAGGLMFSGALIAALDYAEHISPDTAQTLNILQDDLGIAALVVGTSVAMIAAGVIILKTRFLPVWLGWFAIAAGVISQAGPVGFFGPLLMGVWILVVSVLMWRFEERIPVPADPADVLDSHFQP